jgi:hypothetical protein
VVVGKKDVVKVERGRVKLNLIQSPMRYDAVAPKNLRYPSASNRRSECGAHGSHEGEKAMPQRERNKKRHGGSGVVGVGRGKKVWGYMSYSTGGKGDGRDGKGESMGNGNEGGRIIVVPRPKWCPEAKCDAPKAECKDPFGEEGEEKLSVEEKERKEKNWRRKKVSKGRDKRRERRQEIVRRKEAGKSTKRRRKKTYEREKKIFERQGDDPRALGGRFAVAGRYPGGASSVPLPKQTFVVPARDNYYEQEKDKPRVKEEEGKEKNGKKKGQRERWKEKYK